MNRRRFLAALGLASLAPVENAIGKTEPEVVERVVVQDKLLQWNPEGIYYNPQVGKYVQIKELD